MRESFWTLRLFGLGKPFVDMDVDATLRRISKFVREPIQSLRYALPDERKSQPLRNAGDINASLPDWRGRLTLTGRTRAGVDLAIDLWRLERTRGVDPKVSGYQCHQLMLDFPWSCVAGPMTVADALTAVTEMADAFDATFGVVCPRDKGLLRQVYRERGLTEGIPDLLHVTLLGGAYRSALQEHAVRSVLVDGATRLSGSILGMSLIDDWGDELSKDQVDKVKTAIGHQYFAGERSLDQGNGGAFGVERHRILPIRRHPDLRAVGLVL